MSIVNAQWVAATARGCASAANVAGYETRVLFNALSIAWATLMVAEKAEPEDVT